MKNPLNILRAARAYLRFVGDLDRLNEVFALSDSLSDPKILKLMADDFRRDDTGRRALEEKPRLGRVDLKELRTLPEGTFGRVFAEHMFANNLAIEAIPSLKSDDELTFLRAHLYETHDIWHAVTGFGADIPDELGLQAFYLAQFPARLALVILSAGLLNTLFFSIDQVDPRMQAIARGWLMGHKAKKLFGVRWNDLWETPIAEVRKRFGIDIELADRTAPSLRVMQAAALSSLAGPRRVRGRLIASRPSCVVVTSSLRSRRRCFRRASRTPMRTRTSRRGSRFDFSR